MAQDDAAPEGDLPAGDFATWLSGMQAALRGDTASDVPCGTCTACCTSSQFVHIAPDETETLARIPAALLFPAPGLPEGHMLLGYDEHGHCPMFVDGRCSIYADRPRTCRTYDCRIFAAAGVEPEADQRPRIAEQARRWTFGEPTEDRALRDAVRAAAAALREPAANGAVVPANATHLAVLAIKRHEAYLPPVKDAATSAGPVAPPRS